MDKEFEVFLGKEMNRIALLLNASLEEDEMHRRLMVMKSMVELSILCQNIIDRHYPKEKNQKD